ncbi:hypothetical protein D9Q98_004511 [Chlorella vulgaris]|uniref:Uncharacterized protein n=1 Tax=Chlorella vulgaris TaxID=3077 RepID=A0A9D4TQ29_CHLVU|nr:hypothetical protein D9Q98_004511 [Chlorella vulgaris]
MACKAALLLLAAAASVQVAAQGAAADGPTYYIAADVVDWNYAPAGVNLCNGELFTGDPRLWTQLGMGSVYKKALYQQYTDATFKTLVPKPESEQHTGMLGPIIRAAVGQVVTVVLKNNLSFPCNLEPSGVQPEKPGADGAAALSPEAAPGATVTYRWLVPKSMGPGPMEPSAKLWLYRSTVDLMGDGNAGLLGPMLVSNTPEVNTGDVAAGQERDIITVLQVLDENSSPFFDTNLGNRTALSLGVTDDGLVEGNLKHGINGYLYCNAPGLMMTQGESVRWHMASLGSETDMHNLHIHGNTFLNNGHRADQLSMIPGTARSVQFSTDNAGQWLLHCHVNDHINAGMKAMYQVARNDSIATELAGVPEEGLGGTTRTYFIEAEEEEWDYVPLGGDFCSGKKVAWTEEQEVFTTGNAIRPGSKFEKARYVEYTNDTFTEKKIRGAQDAYLGLLGPIIRAEVGDVIQVVFKNSLRFPATMHPHGVAYLKSSEGSPYFDGTMGADTDDDMVPPGETYTYTWHVPETAGPGPADASTLLWMYHSHTDEVRDTYAGLVGAIVIGRKGELKADLTASTVDREVVLFFMVSNEMNSLYADVNAQEWGFNSIQDWEAVAEEAYNTQAASDQQLALQGEELQQLQAGSGANSTSGTTVQAAGRRLMEEEEEEEGYEEPLLKHIINGYLFCNMPVLSFNQGDRVRFHVMALGTEVDMHTPNLVGQTMQVDNGQRGAAVAMMPGAMHSIDVVMANPGTAVVQCRVADHISAGMQALVKVYADGEVAAEQEAAAAKATVKRYYIAAEPVDWDYTPSGKDACTNSAFGPDAEVFVQRTNATIGSKNVKAQYRQYTDASFTELAPQPASHGILGPTLVAEVGQTLEIVFFNDLDFEANIMLDGGLELLPAGADGDDASLSAPVSPGGNFTYRYYVPDSAGPGSEDLSTIAYAYTSSVDLVGHPNAGLIGVLVVGSPGTFKGASEVPEGVDEMLPLLFTIMDEGASPLLQQSMDAAGLSVAATFQPAWGESNLKHNINGYMYCNLPGFTAARNSTVRLLLVGMGSEADMHSPIFTGQVLKTKASAYATAELMPTITRVVDVAMEQSGKWPVYCSVHDHYIAGMRATLVVE